MTDCTCEKKERHDWFPMEAAAFLNSDTVALCPEPWHVQAFLHMLLLAWQGPGISASPRVLGVRLGLTEAQVEELMAGPVGEQWTECCGKLWNAQLEAHRDVSQAKRDEHRGARSAAGKAGGKASGEARRRKAELKARAAQEAVANDSEADRTKSNDPERSRTTPNERGANEPTGHDRTGQDIQLPSGACDARAPATSVEPVPQPKLDRALTESLEPVPPEAESALRTWAEHVGERTQTSKGVAYWRGLVTEARKDPPGFAARVGFSIHVDAKSVLSPKPEELSAWQGEHGKGREQFVTGRVAVQRANMASLDEFAAKGQGPASQAASPPGLPPARNALELLGLGDLAPKPVDVDSEDVA